jgi:hypothetical protein
MVSVDELDALDLLIWFGRGAPAARQLGCNQSTISRRCQTVLHTFGLRLHKDSHGWPCTESHDLLERERRLHQLYRLKTGQPLRIDASLLAAPLLRQGAPSGWWRGPLDEVGWQRPFQLLRQRILDAWVSGMAQELPAQEQEWFISVPLLETPMLLAASASDPLTQEPGLAIGDVAHLPRLAPRAGSYLHTETLLGAWRRQLQPLELDSRPWRRSRHTGCSPAPHARLLHYNTAVSLLDRPDLRPLRLNLGVSTVTSLVMHRDLADEPRLQELVLLLRQRAAQLDGQASRVATP